MICAELRRHATTETIIEKQVIGWTHSTVKYLVPYSLVITGVEPACLRPNLVISATLKLLFSLPLSVGVVSVLICLLVLS